LKGEKLKHDYIKVYKLGIYMAMKKEKDGGLLFNVKSLCLSLTNQFQVECPLATDIC
jgi:hypothetical protein